jgi:uncharacterized protein YbgA (DUF1722 family)
MFKEAILDIGINILMHAISTYREHINNRRRSTFEPMFYEAILDIGINILMQAISTYREHINNRGVAPLSPCLTRPSWI